MDHLILDRVNQADTKLTFWEVHLLQSPALAQNFKVGFHRSEEVRHIVVTHAFNSEFYGGPTVLWMTVYLNTVNNTVGVNGNNVWN